MSVEVKRTIVWTFLGRILEAVYYVFCAFWLIFPLLLTVFAVPELTGFLKNIGQQLPLRTRALMEYSYICGIICVIINIGYPTWHFFIKRHRTSVFKNKLFFWWVFSTNFALLLWLGSAVFGPVYYY